MKESSHSLVSLTTYLNKGFALRLHARQMSDPGPDPAISAASVFLALRHALVFRLPSFQQRDAERAHSYRPPWIGAERAFRDDTLGYSWCGFHLEPLERMLVDVNRRLKRRKAFDVGGVQGHWVAALDGIEVWSSFSRRGESCLERRVMRKDQAGRRVEPIQYDHRVVGCQMIHSPVKPFLALEWLRPGEGEDTAALRLLSGRPRLQGSHFFAILLLDALQAQSPVLDLLRRTGWEAVICLKQDCRDLYPSAVGLFAHRPPDDCWTEQRDHKTYRVQLGDTGDSEALPLTLDHPEPVRVVRSQEVLERNGYRQGELIPPADRSGMAWDHPVAGPGLSCSGHDRWKQENHGWMDLTPHGAFQQGFLHACRHRPKRRHAAGQRERVPNQGLAAVTLILLMAFAWGSAFVRRHSKLVRRHHLTALAVAAQLHRCISKAPPSVRAPT